MKKIMSMITAIVMIMCAVYTAPTSAGAEDALKITTAEELKVFADSVNGGDTYEGKTVTLANDIDLSTVCGPTMGAMDMIVSWTPIGDFDDPFDGTFDGAGHIVSGLYINSMPQELSGLFGYCGEGSQILNLVVDGSITVGYPTSGEWAQPPIWIGGISGGSAGRIENCHNKVSINGIGNGAFAGGICSLISERSRIDKCINTGVIASEGRSGAVVSIVYSYSDCLGNCYYLEGTAEDSSGAEAKTAEQFASGEVAYLLGSPWGQKIGVDEYPVYDGDAVYLIDGKYTNAPKKVVTVAPPKVSHESGVLLPGTKVTVSPTDGNGFCYKINGGDWINPLVTGYTHDVTLTIVEDTTLVVKSYIDAIEKDTEYIFPEATYTYTVDGCVIPPEYPYVINSVKLVSGSGVEYHVPPEGKSFIVDVNVKKFENRDNMDYFVVAVYGDDNSLVSLNYIKANLPQGSEFSAGVNIPKSEKRIGEVKAFVWNSLGGMTPLAEEVSLGFVHAAE